MSTFQDLKRWLAGGSAFMEQRDTDLRGQVALITGGTRGLGFLLAREFAREGCKLVICARDEAELARVKPEMEGWGAEVLTIQCDVSDKAQVDSMIEQANGRFGRVDILVNNAGVIMVGPYHEMKLADYEQAMGIMYWGVVYTTQAVLPQMRQRHSGRIVNITSVGGKVPVPHLLPYVSAKFAATAYSDGLRAEIAGEGISVTTIAPGLMRTGSYLNAYFKGEQEQELTWFGLGDNTPLISMDAERAARQIVTAAKNREAGRILSIPANLAALIYGLFPTVTPDIAGFVNRVILPKPGGAGPQKSRGMAVNERKPRPLFNALTVLGQLAAKRLNQYPGPLSVLNKTHKA
ncbi:MAG TPA: SDR family NAD(P)-dependent oxidoreductase [Chloroflexia bacterium]|nr:SDR family NAD(P)-dependent oxidoreductase [Chloroflexia bacterium]